MGSSVDLFPAPSPDIVNSLKEFRKKYPDPLRVGFLMMRFGRTTMHERIVKAIKKAAAKHRIAVARADDRVSGYHQEVFQNVMTHIYGCAFGIAVFERLEDDLTNPNLAFELGYMYAIRKPVCLLKDKTIRSLPTDIISRLYIEFDAQDPEHSIPAVVSAWFREMGLVTRGRQAKTPVEKPCKKWIQSPRLSKRDLVRLTIEQRILRLAGEENLPTHTISQKLRQSEGFVSQVLRLYGMPPTGGNGIPRPTQADYSNADQGP